MEQHRVQTKFGPIDVRVYRLKYGWWPVALGGRERLPADPVIEGHALPESVDAALRRFVEAIDALPAERPGLDADAAEQHHADEPAPAALPLQTAQAGDRLERR